MLKIWLNNIKCDFIEILDKAKGMLLLKYLPTRCCDCELRNSIDINKTVCHVTLKDISDNEYFYKNPKW